MSKNFIDVLKTSCIQLAHNTIINHPQAGRLINTRLEQEGYGKYTIKNDKRTWKYYLNMAGLYHAYDHDRIYKINKDNKIGFDEDGNPLPGLENSVRYILISVPSDTGVKYIEFRKEVISDVDTDVNLALNYQFGGRFYNDLVGMYPELESLIKGILHPISLDVSTNADSYCVLYCGGYYRTRLNYTHSEYSFIKGSNLIYDEINLIEEWEYSLIEEIDSFTRNFFRQHDNATYAEYNDLWFATSIGLYYLNLPMLIFNIRFEKSKGLETHSGHVKLFLNSHLFLDQFMVYLSRKQYMYLYQDFNWLYANTGKQKVLDELIEKLLKESGISVFVYIGLQNTKELGINDTSEITFIRRPYTKLFNTTNSKIVLTAEQMIELEKNAARDNDKNVDIQVKRVNYSSDISKSSHFKTKVLETQYSNQTQIRGISKEEFFWNNCVWSAFNGEYSGLINLNLPVSEKFIQLTVKNAIIFFYYCYAKAYLRIEPLLIPELLLHHIPKTHCLIPSLMDLEKSYYQDHPDADKVTKDHIQSWIKVEDVGDEFKTETLIKDIVNPFSINKELNQIVRLSPVTRSYNSSIRFNLEMEKRWIEFEMRELVIPRISPLVQSAQVKKLNSDLYHVKKLKIDLKDDKGNTISYPVWLKRFNLDIDEIDEEGLRVLCIRLFAGILGYKDNDPDFWVKKHKALINLIKVFSSYNIQFVSHTEVGERSNLGVNPLRYEHDTTRSLDDDDIHICKYPDYEDKPAHTNIKTCYYGFNMFCDEASNTELLSQEQYKELIHTENDDGIKLEL